MPTAPLTEVLVPMTWKAARALMLSMAVLVRMSSVVAGVMTFWMVVAETMSWTEAKGTMCSKEAVELTRSCWGLATMWCWISGQALTASS